MDEDKIEQEALKVDPEAIKAEIISEMGFDEIEDAERIDIAVSREVKNRTIASKAIGTKIKQREEHEKELETLKKTPKEAMLPEELDRKLDEKLEERLVRRDIDALDYSDDIKKEISDYAKYKGLTIKQAELAPHIVPLIEQFEKQRKTEESSSSRTHRAGGEMTHTDVAPEVSWDDPESVKKYEAWKDEERKKFPA